MSISQNLPNSGDKRPLVSVVIPTYRRRQQTIAAVRSALSQIAADLEVIVVDDGSGDGSDDFLESFFSQNTPEFDRVSFCRQPNQGASAARNTGISRAQGAYIAFLDSDDVWAPDKLKWQLDAFAQLGPTCAACFTDARLTNQAGMNVSSFQEHGRDYRDMVAVDPSATLSLASSFSGFWISTLLVRSEILRQVGGFTRNILFAEDRDLHFRLSLVTSIGYVNKQLVEIDRTPSPPGSNERPWDSHELQFCQQQHMLEQWLAMGDRLAPDVRRTVKSALGALHSSQANWHLENSRYHQARQASALALRYKSRPGTLIKFALAWLLPPLARRVAPKTRRIGTAGHAS